MALFAIGDLHLSLGTNKPMEIFPGWQDHVRRLEEAWRRQVAPGDTVVLAGDTSWAMGLEETLSDFSFIQALPGKKWLLKGNHDYWWNTQSKMQSFFDAQGLGSLGILHNSCVVAEGAALCGTRGWLFEPGGAHDEKIKAREAGRLRHSLECAAKMDDAAEKIVFLHYPPLYPGSEFGEVMDIMCAYGVKRCYYGHLHGHSIKRAVQGLHGGIHFTLISADALDFSPLRIPVLDY